MRIEAYFERVKNLVENCPFVQLSDLTYEKRGTYEGFVHGEVIFVDNSVLHLREYVDVEMETTAERLMYVYHYVDGKQEFQFRYDDTGHHQDLKFPTYPHHKHDSSEKNVLSSSAPDLAAVLDEIQGLIVIP